MADRINVVIVDDIAETRDHLAKLLSFEPDINVAGSVASGPEAITLASEGDVDIVLLDINMPGMDGLELLKHMRGEQALKDLPVIMCTTSSYDQDIARAKALGATAYMTKPADLAKLRPALEQIKGLRLHEEGDGFALVRAP